MTNATDRPTKNLVGFGFNGVAVLVARTIYARIERAVAAARCRSQNKAGMLELTALDDRLLRDIGIDRNEIPWLFDGPCDDRSGVPSRPRRQRHSDYRTQGNEHWEFDADGLMRRRDMNANDVPINPQDRCIEVG